MSQQQQHGFSGLLKEGYRHYAGLEEAVYKNIGACRDISKMTRTSLGPNGMKKMVINYLEKQFVTSDAATVLKELEVQHPAAKMLVMASKMQENECGDATNLVITLAGELLDAAEDLLKMGLKPALVTLGYEMACKKAVELLPEMVTFKVEDVSDKAQVKKAIRGSLTAKHLGLEDLFTDLVSDACLRALPRSQKSFDTEHVRVAKILGGAIQDSFVLNGLLVARNVEGMITEQMDPKIAVYSCPLDCDQADTKGTVLIKNADDLMNYTKGEEDHAEQIVKSIADSGVKVVVCGGSVADIMLHYMEKYKIMVVRVMSKFELRRLARCVGAIQLTRLGAPTAEEMGHADHVFVQEIGSQKVTIFKRDSVDCKLATIVLRGSTNNYMEDIERAFDDSISTFRNLIKDNRFLPGAAAAEIYLAEKLEEEGQKLKGLEQYAYNRYAQAFDQIGRILAENNGMKTDQTVTQLRSLCHQKFHGIDVINKKVVDSESIQVYDHLVTKNWAIKLATDAAITVLRVDQIIISKPAGGPKPKQNNAWDED